MGKSVLAMVRPTILLILLLSACTTGGEHDDVTTLVSENAPGLYAALTDTTAASPYLISANLCVDRGAAQIVSVALSPLSSGQMRLLNWGVRSSDLIPPSELYPGAEAGSLDTYANFSHHPVTTPCSEAATRITGITIQIERYGRRSAAIPSFRVRYRSSGTIRSTLVDYAITLCAPGDHTTHCP